MGAMSGHDLLNQVKQEYPHIPVLLITAYASIAESVKAYVAESNKTSTLLAEAINTLSDKVELLETKLDAIKDLEIPRPVVQMTTPDKVKKTVHRDDQGLITHIEETIDNEETYKKPE